jgi:hypothetical protein
MSLDAKGSATFTAPATPTAHAIFATGCDSRADRVVVTAGDS